MTHLQIIEKNYYLHGAKTVLEANAKIPLVFF
jgi:hypothetical protein